MDPEPDLPVGDGESILCWEVSLVESVPPPVESGPIRNPPDDQPGPFEVLVSLQPDDGQEPCPLIPFPTTPAIRRRLFVRSLVESSPGENDLQTEEMREKILLWLRMLPWRME